MVLYFLAFEKSKGKHIAVINQDMKQIKKQKQTLRNDVIDSMV